MSRRVNEVKFGHTYTHLTIPADPATPIPAGHGHLHLRAGSMFKVYHGYIMCGSRVFRKRPGEFVPWADSNNAIGTYCLNVQIDDYRTYGVTGEPLHYLMAQAGPGNVNDHDPVELIFFVAADHSSTFHSIGLLPPDWRVPGAVCRCDDLVSSEGGSPDDGEMIDEIEAEEASGQTNRPS